MNAKHQVTEYGSLSSKLLCSKLSDLCVDKIGVQTGPFGSQLHKEDYVDIGTPIITVEHLGNNRISHVDTPFITDEDKKRLSKYQLKSGDIVFSRVGSVDRRALVRKEEDGWLFSGRCLRVRVDKTKIDPVYLSYFFGLESFKKYIRSIAVGATMPSINTKILSDIPIYYPECLEEQKRIAHIFITNDEKVNINNQANQTLEQMAQAIFKSWFVDFDPVKAKMNGEQPEGMDAATASLFPEKLVESELGLIPEGWKPKQLKDVLELAYGKALKKTDRVDGDVPVYGSGGLTGYHNQSLVDGPGIIVGRKGTVGSVYWEPKAFYPIDTVFYVKPKAGYSLNYCHLILQNLSLKDMNTDAAVPGLNRNNAYRLDVIIPSEAVLNKFEIMTQSFQSMIDANNAQNASLSLLRETLLPKLLSGEIELEAK